MSFARVSLFSTLFGTFLLYFLVEGRVHYDTFSGLPITEEEYKKHVDKNTTDFCTIEIENCDEHDWRRSDGTCNNLRHPSRGGSYTPFLNLLPPIYYNVDQPRKSKDGGELPPFRKVRIGALSAGRSLSSVFTFLTTVFWLFVVVDITSPADTINYMLTKPSCCSKEGLEKNKRCLQIDIPEDDPVHRFSGIRCQNQTVPLTFQNTGCMKNGTTPRKVDVGTPIIDLSNVYGNNAKDLNEKGRLFQGGLLKFDDSDGKIWPPRTKGRSPICFANEDPHETRCHDTPNRAANAILNPNLGVVWFWRQHNSLAKKLAKLNPCWNDDRLFNTARDINTALALQILYYELLPALFGRENMIRDGIISYENGHRDIYNETETPQVCLECLTVHRWGHAIQNGMLKLYDKRNNFLKQFPIVNLTCRPGFLDVDNNIDHITLGLLREPCGEANNIVDPDMSERALTNQLMSDVFTNDLVKNRMFGFQPYVSYLEYCTGKKYKRFEDLIHVMEIEKIEQLHNIYNHVDDIDLMTGIWMENPISRGFVPSTFYCLASYQYKKNIRTDRHWYERPNRPHAFTLEQLQEIRKATIAKLLCDFGDSVTRIQPHAFLLPRQGNEIDDCEKTTSTIDLSVFIDPSCEIKMDYF